MKNVSNFNHRKFCILSKNEKSSLTNFMNFSEKDNVEDFAFQGFSIGKMAQQAPDTIIIDKYYSKSNYELIINSIIEKFQNTNIFVISPEFAEYNNVIKSTNCQKHYFSNLNESVIQLINSTKGKDPSEYLAAC